MHIRHIRFAAVLLFTVAVPALAQNTAHEQGRDDWQKVDEIFAAMGVRPGAVVADVGAGGGYFTTRLARAVGESGRVYAVDIGADVIRRLRSRVASEGLQNVELIQSTTDDPKLPEGSLDAALIVNAYHEMSEHQAMLTKLKAALKPTGRLVIVEPISPSRRSKTRDQQTKNHEIGMDYVMQDARAAGFTQLQARDPFTKRVQGHGDEEWLLVLAPAPAETEPPASVQQSENEDWKSPALRITPEDFKRLPASDVLVLDVRDPDSYRQGHLPGAVLMPLEELAKPETAARLAAEKRRLITYCS